MTELESKARAIAKKLKPAIEKGKEPKAQRDLYGTAHISSSGATVLVDGSPASVRCHFGVNCIDGDRVICHIANHSVTIIANLTHPCLSVADVLAYLKESSSHLNTAVIQDVVLSDSTLQNVDLYNFTATGGTIENTLIKGSSIDCSTFANGTILGTAINASSFTDGQISGSKITDSSITGGKIAGSTITGSHIDGGSFSNGQISGAAIDSSTLTNIPQASIVNLSVDYAKANAANITNLTAADGWIDKLMVQTNMLSYSGTVYKLDAIEVDAGKITTGQLVADRIALQGNDGLYYAINVDALGQATASQLGHRAVSVSETDNPKALGLYEATSSVAVAGAAVAGTSSVGSGFAPTEDTSPIPGKAYYMSWQDELKRSIHADSIIAGTITADKITASNIVGTGGWINLRNGTFAYVNAASGQGIAWNGTDLVIAGKVTIGGNSVVLSQFLEDMQDDIPAYLSDLTDDVGYATTEDAQGYADAAQQAAISYSDASISTLDSYVRGFEYVLTDDTSAQDGTAYYERTVTVAYSPIDMAVGDDVTGMYVYEGGSYAPVGHSTAMEGVTYYMRSESESYSPVTPEQGDDPSQEGWYVATYANSIASRLEGAIGSIGDLGEEIGGLGTSLGVVSDGVGALNDRVDRAEDDIGDAIGKLEELGGYIHMDAEGPDGPEISLGAAGHPVRARLTNSGLSFDARYSPEARYEQVASIEVDYAYGEVVKEPGDSVAGMYVISGGGYVPTDPNDVAVYGGHYYVRTGKSKGKLRIHDAVVMEELQFGNWKWMPRKNGNLALKWTVA